MRINISIDNETKQKAQKIGNGNVSAGIRGAVEKTYQQMYGENRLDNTAQTDSKAREGDF